MSHPRLSLDAMSTFKWTFDQDLALWRDLAVRHAGLLISKIDDDAVTKFSRVREAGIQVSTVIVGSFDLRRADTWDRTRASHREVIDRLAEVGGHSLYFTPGRTTGAPWREVLEIFAQAVGPSVAYAKQRGVHLAIEPSLRTDVSFVNTLRDAIDVAERTGAEIVVDFGNMWMERDAREVLQRASPHIALVQICDVIIGETGRPPPGGRVHIGEGELPLRRLMHEVLDSGYQGVFDLEVLGPRIESEGYDSAVRRGVENASAFLRELGV